MKNELETDRQLKVGKANSDLELQRQQTMEVFKDTLKNAPLTRLSAKAQTLAGQDVPLEPAAATTLPAFDPAAAKGEPGKFRGDITAARADIAKITDPVARAEALAQLDGQVGEEQERQRGIVSGKTRKRTNDEALQAAVDDAKVNDIPAFAAYEEKVGKPAREDRRVANSEKREDTRLETDKARAANEAARIVAYDKKTDSQEAYQRRREDRQDELLELQERRLTAQGDKAETQSQRTAVTALMTNTEREIERTMALAKDPLITEAEKALYQGRVNRLTTDLGRYRKSLESFGGDSVVPAAPAPASSTNQWNSTTGEVLRDGKPIGMAKSAAEARALIAGKPAAVAPAPPPKPLPRGMDDVPGVVDAGRVSKGTDLLPGNKFARGS